MTEPTRRSTPEGNADPRRSTGPPTPQPMPSAPDGQTLRRTFTVEETAELLGISRSTAYECVRTGEIPSLRFRSRIVVPAQAIDALLTPDAAARS